MTILTALKRTTALAAIAALPLAPASVHAESAQVTGTQPPAAEQATGAEQSQQGSQTGGSQAGGSTNQSATAQSESQIGSQTGQQTGQTDTEATKTQGEPGKTGTQSGQAPAQAQGQGSTTGGSSAGQQATSQTDTEATKTQGEPGKTGTQSGQAPAQAQGQGSTTGGSSAGQQETSQTDTEATKTQGEPGKTGTQSGQAPAQAQQGQESTTGGPSAGQQETSQTGTGQTGTGPTGTAQSGQTGNTDTEATQTQGEPGKTGTQSGQAPAQATDDQQAGTSAEEDALVAKVGDSEIRRSDVLMVIGMLPPQLQQQPPETLIPIALDQLVMRELILQEAKQAGLESDPGVSALDASAPEREKEDAMVQAWLEKELGKAVTEEKVQETYNTVKAQMGDQAPDVETLRPQIEQELRQQAFLDLSRDLQEGAEITVYGPDGQPVRP